MMGNLPAMGKQSRAVASAIGLGVILALVAGCGSGGSGGGTSPPISSAAGTVMGQVVSLASSSPVSGATVKTDTGTATTAADGKFSVPAPAGDRTIVQIEATGFAEAFPVARVISGQTTNLGVKLVPIGATATVSVASGTPTAPNPFIFTVQVQDSGTPQQLVQQQFILAIILSGGGGGGTGGGKVGGGGGTVTVSGAPTLVGGTFVPNTGTTGEGALTFSAGNSFSITWTEISSGTAPTEGLMVGGGTADGIPVLVALFSADDTTSNFQWSCHTGRAQQCNGLTINRMAGTATLSNVVLTDSINNTPPITLNGTLTFTPF